MKKLKLFIPVLAFALAITGVFALSSSNTDFMPEEETFATAKENILGCPDCTLIDACDISGTTTCRCEGGIDAYDNTCDNVLKWTPH